MAESPRQNQKITGKQTFRQAVKFVLFSISAGILQVAVFSVIEFAFDPNYWMAYLPALICSVLYNFTVNREFTFQSTANIPSAMLKIFIYYCIFIPASTWWGEALTKNHGWNEFATLAFTMVINFVTEFLVYRIIIFRGKMDTNERAQKKLEKTEGKK